MKDSYASLRMETTKEGVNVRSLAYNTSRVEGHVGARGWGF